jgi:hypothetical protein
MPRISERWIKERVLWFGGLPGRMLSLDHIEQKYIRPNYAQGARVIEDDGVPPLSDPDPVRVNLETIRILSRMQECDGDQCTIGANYHPDFQGKASTTRKEPCFEVTLSATTPEGTTYQQETEVEWTPPPNTAVKVAEMKKEDRL